MSKNEESTALSAVDPAVQHQMATDIIKHGLETNQDLRGILLYLVAQAAAGRIPPETLSEIRSMLELSFTSMAFDAAKGNTTVTKGVMSEIKEASLRRHEHTPHYTIDIDVDDDTKEALGLKGKK